MSSNLCFSGKLGQNFALLWGGAITTTGVLTPIRQTFVLDEV
jgi:hypothetical protein